MPLRLRLALWPGLLTGAILFLLTVVAYAWHNLTQYAALDQALSGAVSHVAGQHATDPLSAEVIAMLGTPILPSIGIRIYGADGQLRADSPNAITAPPLDPRTLRYDTHSYPYDAVTAFFQWMLPHPAHEGVYGLFEQGAQRWRVYVLPTQGTTAYFVAVAPLYEIDASVTSLRQLIPFVVIGGAGLTLLVATYVADRTLRPVALLTHTAQTIAHARTLERRVPISNRADELGHLAQTFNEMLASLEHLHHAQQRFVADAAHELRTPLTIIRANLELLAGLDQHSDSEQREAIQAAYSESLRLSRLVEDLLSLAYADAGIALRRLPLDLDVVVLETLRQAQPLATGRTLKLGAFELVRVAGDTDRLRQLLLILIDNALKYTPAGGVVTVGLAQADSSAILTVQDTGVGIAPREVARLFDRFYRADATRRRDPGGTGLGLAIAQWIVEQHKGAITITSKVGEGTLVTITLPLMDAPKG